MTADLDAWVAEHEQVLREVRGRAAPDGVELDDTPESLPRLIDWVAGRMVRRPEGASTAAAPAWSTKPGADVARFWTDETLWLLAAAAHYYGEVLTRSSAGARWALGHDPHPGYAYEGDVVLELPRNQVNPLRVVYNCAAGVRGGLRAPDAVLTAYRLALQLDP